MSVVQRRKKLKEVLHTLSMSRNFIYLETNKNGFAVEDEEKRRDIYDQCS